ncbi:hypothetical protein FJZ36_04730 [Candidatus Poribacteria bacterium]|nr:hypothetical protein [Candidatus Poribacteria bacterium]
MSSVRRFRWRALGGLASIAVAIAFLGCGDVEKPGEQDPVIQSINAVLRDRWQKGYMTEDIDLYMSAYWASGFLYQSDMGTDSDPTDDVIFDDITLERDSAIRIFKKFQDIEIEISEPPEVKPLNQEKTRYEVRNHYRIQFIVSEGVLEGGFTGAYAEGDSIFIFEKRLNPSTGKDEWRIVEWRDESFTPDEIKAANKL